MCRRKDKRLSTANKIEWKEKILESTRRWGAIETNAMTLYLANYQFWKIANSLKIDTLIYTNEHHSADVYLLTLLPILLHLSPLIIPFHRHPLLFAVHSLYSIYTKTWFCNIVSLFLIHTIINFGKNFLFLVLFIHKNISRVVMLRFIRSTLLIHHHQQQHQ
jgi:hypothetical protein